MTEGGRREKRQREGRDKGRRREGGRIGKEGGMERKEEGKEEREIGNTSLNRIVLH